MNRKLLRIVRLNNKLLNFEKNNDIIQILQEKNDLLLKQTTNFQTLDSILFNNLKLLAFVTRDVVFNEI
jgi:hypothetical protein